MFAQPLYTKTELADFVLQKAAELAPSIRFTPGEDDLTYRFEYTDSAAAGVMHLHSLYSNYCRTGDLNRVIDFLNAQFQTAEYIAKRNTGELKGVDLFRIYPSIRRADFCRRQTDGEDMLRTAHVPRLETVFIENHISYYVFLTRTLIEPVRVYMNEEEIKEQAFTNLRRRGWNPPQMTLPSLPYDASGQFLIFAKTDYPFQHQFFLPDMSRDRLPRHFLVAIPAQDMAVVYTSGQPIDSLDAARTVAKRSGFAKFVRLAHEHEPSPLSDNIYWANGDQRLYVRL